jgi:hypothetical protein
MNKGAHPEFERDRLRTTLRHSISILQTTVFKGERAPLGAVFFIAVWCRNEVKFEEKYIIRFSDMEKYGAEACRESVITQVLTRHIEPANPTFN